VNAAGAPSDSAGVPEPPCVQSDNLTAWPLPTVILFVSRSAPSAAVQVIVQASFR